MPCTEREKETRGDGRLATLFAAAAAAASIIPLVWKGGHVTSALRASVAMVKCDNDV